MEDDIIQLQDHLIKLSFCKMFKDAKVTWQVLTSYCRKPIQNLESNC